MAYFNNQHFFNFFNYWIWTCDSDVVNVKEVLDEVTICRHRMCNLSRKPSSYSQRKLFVSEAYKKLKRVMFTKWCHMKCVLSFFSVCFLTLIMLYKLTLIVIAITHSRNFQNRIGYKQIEHNIWVFIESDHILYVRAIWKILCSI